MPFDPTIKRTEGTLRGPDGKTFKCTKGAPHIILKLVEVDQEEVAKRVNWKVRRSCFCCSAGAVLPCCPAALPVVFLQPSMHPAFGKQRVFLHSYHHTRFYSATTFAMQHLGRCVSQGAAHTHTAFSPFVFPC
jgi:magnesium-transporting ATPase (P-type)